MINKIKKNIKNHTFIITIFRFFKKLVLTIVLFPKLNYYRMENRIKHNIIFCESFVFFKYGLVFKHNNWGDDLNKYFIEYVSNKKVIFIPYSETFLNPKDVHYSMIGSVIGNYPLNNTIIYGSGLMKPNKNLTGEPITIISVRGPLTRKALVEKNIQCPKAYGDPVILLPFFYKPKKIHKKKIGIIPNVGTKENDLVNKFLKDERTMLIDTTIYSEWTDIIDQIYSCETIISESLHGLIVAEIYGIPNVWVEFKEHAEHWGFKFNDFYESIEKYNLHSKKINNKSTLDCLLVEAKKWSRGNIDFKKQLSYFPFEIKKDQVIDFFKGELE